MTSDISNKNNENTKPLPQPKPSPKEFHGRNLIACDDGRPSKTPCKKRRTQIPLNTSVHSGIYSMLACWLGWQNVTASSHKNPLLSLTMAINNNNKTAAASPIVENEVTPLIPKLSGRRIHVRGDEMSRHVGQGFPDATQLLFRDDA
ncbi:hypothetical protein CEXT_262751 [Caerostris extrusa]|uniref:Uncharacterized protein n=1 Tax=Caerostris extrusa TaxID=172846 RepID=A0AAV4WF82_CAEEX|nr:hypothetical protein CEXT_262751 [Caerostris extrusa]